MPLTSFFILPISWDLIRFPPDWEPRTVPPPEHSPSIAYPFNIDSQLYNDLLDVKWPLSIAIGYATVVSYLNRVNKARANKPWAISKTGAFTAFVLAHNIFLTIYSAWTFVGMLKAMMTVFGGILEDNPLEKYGIAPVIDALCKLSGPRGPGNAATWEPFTARWSVKNTAIQLLSGNPDPTDVGRLWNEGLAFYGWLFYLSKFYEVLDTLIILAKGKRSSLLQTYHHAGAMMCMWAGIRFMSPPIWMFVQLNSGIHTLMYFYYTLAALGIKVPGSIKQSLTSLQIAQFIVGSNFALSHLFIGYQVPVNTPYVFKQAVSSVATSITSALASPPSTAAAGLGFWFRQGALRAAGFEGLAENLRDDSGQRLGLGALKAQLAEDSRAEIRHRLEYPTVHCLDTSGQAFAIWLNCLYLAPLTYLFGRFFYVSYIKRAAAATKHKEAPQTLSTRMVRSGSDAARGVDREIRQAMGDAQGYNSPIDDEFAISLQDEIDSIKDKAVSGAITVKEKVIEGATVVKEKAVDGATVVKEKAVDGATIVKETAISSATVIKERTQELTSTVVETVERIVYDTTTSTSNFVTETVVTEDSSISEKEIKTEPQVVDTLPKPATHDDEHHDAHVKTGESYADAVKTEVEDEEKVEPEKPSDGNSSADGVLVEKIEVEEADDAAADGSHTANGEDMDSSSSSLFG